MRRKLIAGAALLALLMNSPQASADDDDVVIFGGEFEDDSAVPKPVKPPEPIKVPEPKPVKPPEPVKVPEPIKAPEPVRAPDPVKASEPVDEPTPSSQIVAEPPVDDDDDIGDVLIFDDLSRLKMPAEEEERVDEPTPTPIEEPTPEPVTDENFQVDRPFQNPTDKNSDERVQKLDEPVVIQPPSPADETKIPSQRQRAERQRRQAEQQQNLRELQPRFIKLAADDTYTYYLDKQSVQWRKMPYSTSEYMADVWVRMVERVPSNYGDDMESYAADSYNTEISLARERGYRYREEDLHVLKRQSYVLEHYYLRPKTKQIQFLCELEVFGRPQNTINERAYDYNNWENLVPGSVESAIYNATIQIIGKSKADPKGHMTFSDMLDEYLRISL